ncbi:hypothetical protein DSCO28_47090 [Desulfosarcina ovata subsp. sediminis]|uniref:Uncharacterized protein n=1 Tax=Desulfosarcina ovata subsp. sediminis TaxID=885957 RepID=A0A5K7ZV77_9BACT|nr:hypothetical protein [Desulfosarcina ovata]BBO84143.1 hypothetical protein DSCO28_47090 [Desulfosarcina ovata subsp. sediminis]
MKQRIVAITLLICLPLGCAFYAEKAKMERYSLILDSYETAMRMSDFNTICQYVDPAAMTRQDCLKQFGDIKLVDYKVAHMKASEDCMQVEQEIDVSYYALSNILLKKKSYSQTWTYDEQKKNWLLSAPPSFE